MENKSVHGYGVLYSVPTSEQDLLTVFSINMDIDGDGSITTDLKKFRVIVYSTQKDLFKLKKNDSETINY